MEHGFLKAPWEVMLRNFRAGHKPIAKEVEQLSAILNRLIHLMIISQPMTHGGVPDSINPSAIQSLRTQLTGIKRKIEQSCATDEHSILRCYHRIAHLRARASGGDPPPASAYPSDESQRMEVDNPLPSASEIFATDSVHPLPDANGTSGSNGNGHKTGSPGSTGPNDSVATPNVEHDENDNNALDTHSRWEKSRLDRALADYMLREGMYDTAHMLCRSHGFEHIVDTDIFRESRVVIEALRQHDCTEALRWCAENKRRLQKVSSRLEFRLRLQEFVELARARRKLDAITYMRKHISAACDKERQADIQRFMALLAYDSSTACEPYKDMYGEHKWKELENAFKDDNYRLHGLTRESTIEILLKAGLSSLKTRKCGKDPGRNPNCPTCVEPYLSLAHRLPRSRHENSVLVCSISGQIMDENDPPMAMPNGNVYSYAALRALADENDGIVKDPQNGDEANFSELRKCFIM